MSKIISIGDIHGVTLWKIFGDIQSLLEGKTFKPEYDKYVFVGDYVDSWGVSDKDMISNLKKIIKFKKMFPENVVLLLGNHDISYIFPKESAYNYACSGNRPQIWEELHNIFYRDRDLFQPIFTIGKYVWTHAGFTAKMVDALTYGRREILEKTINDRFQEEDETIFHAGSARGGKLWEPGPFWADKIETVFNMPKEIHQIVGHSRVKGITKIEDKINDSSITYIDCLDTNPQPYILEINN